MEPARFHRVRSCRPGARLIRTRYASPQLPSRRCRSTFIHVMKTIEVNLPEPTLQRLEEAAQRLGLTAEDLLRISVEEKLIQLDDAFRDATDYVVSKNTELYKRLA